MLDTVLYIAQGAIITLKFSILSVIIGLILGTLLGIAKVSHNKVIVLIADIYTSIFRGTPLLVQLSVIYYVMPKILNTKIDVFTAGILTFSLNSCAYVSEIIKGGIQSIDKGQFEACYVLGISRWCMMKDIIIPQAVRRVLPSLINEIADMLKETSLISVLGGEDLMRRAQLVGSETYDYFTPLITAACCYYILVFIVTHISKYVEKKLAL